MNKYAHLNLSLAAVMLAILLGSIFMQPITLETYHKPVFLIESLAMIFFFSMGLWFLIPSEKPKQQSKDSRDISDTKEPAMTINGVVLSDAQSMTIRGAIESFDAILKKEGLGDDMHGKYMVKSYCQNIDDIRNLIV